MASRGRGNGQAGGLTSAGQVRPYQAINVTAQFTTINGAF